MYFSDAGELVRTGHTLSPQAQHKTGFNFLQILSQNSRYNNSATVSKPMPREPLSNT